MCQTCTSHVYGIHLRLPKPFRPESFHTDSRSGGITMRSERTTDIWNCFPNELCCRYRYRYRVEILCELFFVLCWCSFACRVLMAATIQIHTLVVNQLFVKHRYRYVGINSFLMAREWYCRYRFRSSRNQLRSQIQIRVSWNGERCPSELRKELSTESPGNVFKFRAHICGGLWAWNPHKSLPNNFLSPNMPKKPCWKPWIRMHLETTPPPVAAWRWNHCLFCVFPLLCSHFV